MKLSLDQLTIKPLSYQLVLVWPKPLGFLPNISPEFYKNIFGSPDTTIIGNAKNGLTAQKNIPPVVEKNVIINPVKPTLHFGFDKFFITHVDLEELVTTYMSLVREIEKDINNLGQFVVNQLGINIEFEVDFGVEDAMKMVDERFSVKNNSEDFEFIGFGSLKLVMSENEKESKSVQIGIEPRVFNSKALYFHLNDHYGRSPTKTFPTETMLNNIIKDSIDKFSNKVLKTLFL